MRYVIALVFTVAASLVSVSCTEQTGEGAGEQDPESQRLRIGWTAWSDAELVTQLVKSVLEERMGIEVELVMADIGVQYQSVATAELDAMLMAWLPNTHKNFWEKVSARVQDLGVMYEGRLGLAVPTYIPEDALASIGDLAEPEVRDRLGKEITGIDPGAGLMQITETALNAYGLDDYRLVASSGAAMTASLARAIESEEWIVVTAWSPHWMFVRFDLRYLDDPKKVYGAKEQIHAVARPGFREDFPKVAEFLSNIGFQTSTLEELMVKARSQDESEVAQAFFENNEAMIESWLPDEAQAPAAN